MKSPFTLTVLSCLACLIALDIVVRLYVPSTFNAEFYNNLLNPIIGIASIFVYVYTLRYIIIQNQQVQHQNKIILSQSLRPGLDKEIDRLLLMLKETKYEVTINNPDGKKQFSADGLDYLKHISDVMLACHLNDQFLMDRDLSEKKDLDYMYVVKRSYAHLLFVFGMIDQFVGNRFHHYTIKTLVEEINNSKLVDEDKDQLKRRIKKELLGDYLVYGMTKSKSFRVMIPTMIFTKDSPPPSFTFRNISDTDLFAARPWLLENLKESTEKV